MVNMRLGSYHKKCGIDLVFSPVLFSARQTSMLPSPGVLVYDALTSIVEHEDLWRRAGGRS